MTRKDCIISIITKAIRAGNHCPTNDAIAEKLKVSGCTIKREITAMVKAGDIDMRYEGNRRVVSIPGVGESSAKEHQPRYTKSNRLAVPEHQRVDRHTCFRCGGRVEGWVHMCGELAA